MGDEEEVENRPSRYFTELIASLSEKAAAFLKPHEPAPTLFTVRNNGSNAAVVFVHGFSGSSIGTWDYVSTRVENDQTLKTWDIFRVGYRSSLRLDLPGIWSADPSIETLSILLRTLSDLPPLKTYRRLALVAHSMGGLIVQRAILDNSLFRSRLSHVVLFGTPSAGLHKSSFIGRLKRQLRDMGLESVFISALRRGWAMLFPDRPPFVFKVIAGETDEFVGPASSLGPFKDEHRAVVPGNHVTMLLDNGAGIGASEALIDSLSYGLGPRSPVDGARIAVKMGEYQDAIDALLPNAEKLDQNALCSLALALETVGRKEQAVSLLERRYEDGGITESDALGVLAGRLKRRWIVSRSTEDFSKAIQLYQEELSHSQANSDCQQAYYHAINIATLHLLSGQVNSTGNGLAKQFANDALAYCRASPKSGWRHATEGEAFLILGKLSPAIKSYTLALETIASPREVQSMYLQAARVAFHRLGEGGAKPIRECFGR